MCVCKYINRCIYIYIWDGEKVFWKLGVIIVCLKEGEIENVEESGEYYSSKVFVRLE